MLFFQSIEQSSVVQLAVNELRQSATTRLGL